MSQNLAKLQKIVKIEILLKRDGTKSRFLRLKIAKTIFKAAFSVGGDNYELAKELALKVEAYLEQHANRTEVTFEDVRLAVEKVLIKNGHEKTYKAYILYGDKRERSRDMNRDLTRAFKSIIHGNDSNKRENANINADTPMGMMLKFGSESAKKFYKLFLPDRFREMHDEGDIHIHDLDFYNVTTTCCQIDISELFKNGFSTGHGYLREPNDIQTYAALVCIVIQANQNEQHGGQSIPNFDFSLAEGVKKTYRKIFISNLSKTFELLFNFEELISLIQIHDSTFECIYGDFLHLSKKVVSVVENLANDSFTLSMSEKFILIIKDLLFENFDRALVEKVEKFCFSKTLEETNRAVYQAMEALIHNLNTMHSRAGAQVPFSTINYGTDTTLEGRMVIKNVLLALESGLGNGETPIFPIHIFKVKDGVSGEENDPNFDLFKLACRVSAKRLFPNFSFLDAPFNFHYYKKNRPETEVAYMGCRTRVIGNVYDKTREITFGRGNLSFTSINLVRIAIESKKDLELFFSNLECKVDLCIKQLYHRYKIQVTKRVKNFPFLMEQGLWMDSKKLSHEDELGNVLRHGTLSVGFIGLAECLKFLTGKHHGESEESQELGLKIVSKMRERLDKVSEIYNMNYTLLATPAEGLAGRFVRIDKNKFGFIKDVTDRNYYTNSFHIPVHYEISPFLKIRLEAPYHTLTNAGHITYVELDGDLSKNLEAFEQIVQYMKKSGIGYGSINHPVDRDPFCGYTGIINEFCPKCGRKDDDPSFKIERIRRITGYLVGTLDRFNDAKLSEVTDRVKHVTFDRNSDDKNGA